MLTKQLVAAKPYFANKPEFSSVKLGNPLSPPGYEGFACSHLQFQSYMTI